LTVFVGLSVLAVYHPLLLLFDVFLLLAIVLIIFVPLRLGQRTAIDESTAKYEVAGWLEEIVRNPNTFRTGGSQRWVFEKADMLTKQWVKARKFHFRVIFSQILCTQAMYVVASTALLGLGGWLVLRGSLSLGQLVAAELIVSGIVYAVSQSGKYIETWYDLMAAVYKVGHLIDVPVEFTEGEKSSPSVGKGGSLEFSDVSWESARGKELFSDLNENIKCGERTGVVGPSGSGKSAMIELLWRLREPTTGTIRIAGRDLRDLDIDALRTGVAVVSLVEIVHGTLFENVSLNRPAVSRDDVRRAISSVGLDRVVAELPDRFDTVLNPLGGLLSEDELRRLMLARAIVGNPAIIAVDAMFDRASVEMRKIIFDTLFDEDRDWTLLIASDLPEVLQRCERVIELSSSGAEAGPKGESATDSKEGSASS